MRCAAAPVTAIISLTTTFSSLARPEDDPAKRLRELRQVRALTLSSLPNTNATSAILAKVPGSVCAAQPVTTILAAGRWRLSLRIGPPPPPPPPPPHTHKTKQNKKKKKKKKKK